MYSRSNQLKEPSVGGRRSWRTAKIALVIGSFIGLGAVNVLTLTSDAFHAKAYNVLKAVLSNGIIDSAGKAMFSGSFLAHSPTNVRATEIGNATKVLEAEKAALVSANRVLLDKNERLTIAHNALAEKHRTATLTAKKVSDRVATRSVKNAFRNAGSLAGEAIPYVGVGIMYAVTALDIQDACANLRDVNEMNSAMELPLTDHTTVCGLTMPSKEDVVAQVKSNWQDGYHKAASLINRGKEMVPWRAPSTGPLK